MDFFDMETKHSYWSSITQQNFLLKTENTIEYFTTNCLKPPSNQNANYLMLTKYRLVGDNTDHRQFIVFAISLTFKMIPQGTLKT